MKWLLLAAGLVSISAADAPLSRKIENTFRNWKFEELPPAVQKSVSQAYPNQKINDIDREDRHGQTIWEIEFAGGAEEDVEIHVDNDGKILDNPRPPAPAAKPANDAGHKVDFARGAKDQPKSVAKNWDKLPAAVQQASVKYGGKDAVRDIDIEKREDKMVFELEFDRPGQNIELHFTEDGRVLEHIDSKESR